MANDRIHMNTQALNRLRQAIAVTGNSEIGSQPIQREPSVAAMGSISLVSSDKGVSVSSGDTHFVNGWKLVVICSNEAANEFRAGKMTET